MPSLFSLPENHLLEENYQKPFMDWKNNPNPTTNQGLLEAVKPVIDKSLRLYSRGSSTSPTLRSKAEQITLNAVKGYDPSRAKLQTHLMSHLQGLQRATAKEERIISAPEQVLLDHKNLYMASAKLKDELGRDPSDSELADKLNMSLKRISYVRQLRNPLAESTFDVHGSDTERGSYAPAVLDNNDGGWKEFVYHSLPPRDQLVMEHALGLHGKNQLDGLALAKKLNMSPGRVSQIKSRIQQKLDRRAELGVL